MMLAIPILIVCFGVFAMGQTTEDPLNSTGCEQQICEFQKELLTLKTIIIKQNTLIALQNIQVEKQNTEIANQNTRVLEEVEKVKRMESRIRAAIEDLQAKIKKAQQDINNLKKQHTEKKDGEKECPGGWVKHAEKCYLIVDDGSRSWSEASARCGEFGGGLAVIKDADTNNFLKEKLQQSKGNYFWLGATDKQTEGTWLWDKSGAPVVFSDWNDHQPDNYQYNQDCLALFRDYSFRWDDGFCTYETQYICELEL